MAVDTGNFSVGVPVTWATVERTKDTITHEQESKPGHCVRYHKDGHSYPITQSVHFRVDINRNVSTCAPRMVGAVVFRTAPAENYLHDQSVSD